MATETKRVNLFKHQTPLVKPMGDEFVKADFERDLGGFLRTLIATDPDFQFVRNEPPELHAAVHTASFEGVREGAYTVLARFRNCGINDLPERFEYDFGEYIWALDTFKPVYDRLIADPIVQRDLAWHGREDLEFSCETIALEVRNCYGSHITSLQVGRD